MALRQRVLRDVSECDTSVALFGRRQAMPVALGPVGIAGMYARRGEAQAARAASAKGVPFSLSSLSVCDLARGDGGERRRRLVPALYHSRPRLHGRAARRRARGRLRGLLFTVDLPMPGARYRDLHSGMSGPHARWRRLGQALDPPRWAWDVGLSGRPHGLGNFAPVLGPKSGLEDYIGWIGDNFDPSLTWRDLDWIREPLERAAGDQGHSRSRGCARGGQR